MRKIPTPLSKYKQKSPVGPLKKLPVKPLEVLGPNMTRKVEKEIMAKLSKKPDSSAPVRPNRQEPHPLEAVEATPIRPPPVMKQPPVSPPPEMVTGKLGSLCSVM